MLKKVKIQGFDADLYKIYQRQKNSNHDSTASLSLRKSLRKTDDDSSSVNNFKNHL